MHKKETMVIPIKKKYYSETDLYYAMISLYNTVEQWGLTETQIKILIYIIRFDYSKKTKDLICEKLNITLKSLTTNLSYLRQGRVGKKKIKKLLKTSQNNMNITLLSVELKDIKRMIESDEEQKAIYIDFGNNDITKKITTSNGK